MAIHEELNPDDAALPFLTARGMRVLATDNAARTAGVIVVPNRDGTDTVLGVNGVAPWVGDTTPPGRPLDIEATSHLGTALIRWGGELEGGIPSDFRCVQIWARQVGATAAEKTLVGVLSSAGEVNTGVFDAGATLDVWATALDNAHDRDGSPAYNESVESEHVQVEILPIVSQQEFDEAADNILAAADESVKAQIERVDADLAAANEAINKKAEETLAAANQTAQENLNRVQEEIAGEGGKIEQAANSAYERAKEHADELKAQVDAEFVAADKKISDTANSAYERAKDYTDGIKAQVDSDLVATGEAIDAAADKALADAKADTAKHVAQVNKDISDANEQIAANKTAVETEARLRAEGDKLAQDAAAAVKAETDKLATKYDTMDTDVKSVKSDLTKVMSSTTQLEQDMIVSTLIEYAVGDSDTVPPDLATYWTGEPNNSVSVLSDPWGPTTPERTPGTYIWMRTRVTFGDGGQETSAPVLVTGNTGAQGPQGPQGVPGEPGADGLPGAAGTNGKTSYLHLAYANSSDGRTDFSTSDSNRDYIGQYTDFTQQDSTDPTRYAWSKIKGAQGAQGLKGDPGATGLPGAPGADGRTSYAHFAYANSADGRTDFSTTNGVGKKYLGQYVDFVESDSTDPTKYAWSLIVGPQGPQGVAGPKGDKGEDGITRYSYFAYGTSSSGANFSKTPTSNSTYIGVCVTTAATQPTDPSKYTWSLTKGATGPAGPQGAAGAKGDVGEDGKTYYTYFAYGTSASGANFSKTPTANSTYMGVCITLSATQPTTPASYTWSLTKGNQGATGAQGVSVSALTPFWQLAEAKPAQPVNKSPGGGWTSTEPAYVRGKKLWTCSRIDYSNGQWSWTSVQQSSAFEAAELALTTADGKNRRFVQPTTPDVPASELTQGDEWWQTSTKPPETYWLGEPNNSVSVLVDHSGDVEHIWVWNGTRWALNRLSAEDILVSGTVAAGLVTADFFDGARIKGGEFLTSNELIRLNNAGLIMNGKSGERLVTLNATDGTATFNSVSIINGALNAGTIEGAAINGGSFTLRDKDGRAIGHLNSSGMDLGDVFAFAKQNGEWQLSIKGSIRAGSTISGASIVGDSTVTGGVVQTSAEDRRGIKLTGGNLDIYRSDKTRFMRANENGLYISDGSKNVLSFARVLRTYWLGEPNNSVSVLSDGWQLTLDGAIQSGGEITGAVITGGTVQTNAAANRGIKLADSNLDAYTAAGSRFLRLNEAGMWFKDGDANALSFAKDSTGRMVLTIHDAIQTEGAISGATVTGCVVQTVAADNRGIKLKDNNLDVFSASGKLVMQANEAGIRFKDASGADKATFRPDANGVWNLRLTGMVSTGGAISGGTVTGSTVQTTASANRGVKLYSGDATTGNLDVYRADGKLFFRVNEDGLSVKDSDTNLLSFAKVNNAWKLSLKGAIQSGGEISGAAITGAVIRTNTEWQSSEAEKKYRGLVITDGGMFAYKGNGKEEYSMAFTAATGELKLDGAVAANASLTGATINGGVVYGATVTTNSNYASTDPNLRDRGVWIKSNGLVSYDADGKVAVRIDATTGALYAADGVNTNGSFNIYDTDGNITVKLGPGAFGIYKNGTELEPSRLTYLDADNHNHRLLSLWGENGIAYVTQTGWDIPQIQSPCVDMGLQKSVRGGLLVYRGRVKCPNSGDNIISTDTAYNSDYSATGFVETYGTNRSAVAVGFRNNTAQPCIVYIPANTRQLVAMNGPWDWVDLTNVAFGQ